MKRVHRSASLWRNLLTWFDSVRRDLPWRGTKDPYAILVSELMLQQTQVQTVLPYYQRFMQRFPDLCTLALASQEEVLRYWSGLGYYRRGRNLHRAAQTILSEHGGTIPSEKGQLLSLPGIGEYTAGAVLSIAFDQSVPLVDGNVERVLARFFAMDKDIATPEGKKTIWKLAESLVPAARPGCHNQALMELGATVCLPTHPKCQECPLSGECQALSLGKVLELPIKTRRTQREKVLEAVLLVECEGQWLLTNRNEEGLYAGLWQFPWAWRKEALSWADWRTSFKNLADSLGFSLRTAFEVGTTHHAVTFRSIKTTFFLVRKPAPRMDSGRFFRWIPTEMLEKEALPSYQKKTLKLLPSFLDWKPPKPFTFRDSRKTVNP